MDQAIRIGIQKRGGHMFDASCALLHEWWGFEVPADAGTKGRELTETAIFDGASPINATILTTRIEDIVADIADGVLDIGIVSSDVLTEWEAASHQALETRRGIDIRDVGAAGSRLMIGVAQTFLETQSGKDTAWRNAVTLSYEQGIPVYTSFPEDFSLFLEKQNLKIPPIRKRRGTIEAHARMSGSLVIADLVESGDSMRRNGFTPVVKISDSRTLVLINVRQDEAKRPALLNLLDRIAGSACVAA